MDEEFLVTDQDSGSSFTIARHLNDPLKYKICLTEIVKVEY